MTSLSQSVSDYQSGFLKIYRNDLSKTIKRNYNLKVKLIPHFKNSATLKRKDDSKAQKNALLCEIIPKEIQ